MWKGTLREYLRLARDGRVPEGWSYLPRGQHALETACVVLPFADEEAAAPTGFEQDGLDSPTVEDVVSCARQFEDPPGDALLLESFLYYRRHDAFLPHPGASPPPDLTPEEQQLRWDREFYDGLGAELPASPCRRAGCTRGSLAVSIHCRVHHFESFKGRPCRLTD